MEALIILTVLLLVGGGASVYKCRKQEQADYEEYMAERISWTASEVNSEE